MKKTDNDWPERPSVRKPRELTKREKEVLVLAAEGHKNKQIAERLGISVKTVETFRANIKNKLALRNTADLVRYAIQHRYIFLLEDQE